MESCHSQHTGPVWQSAACSIPPMPAPCATCSTQAGQLHMQCAVHANPTLHTAWGVGTGYTLHMAPCHTSPAWMVWSPIWTCPRTSTQGRSDRAPMPCTTPLCWVHLDWSYALASVSASNLSYQPAKRSLVLAPFDTPSVMYSHSGHNSKTEHQHA